MWIAGWLMGFLVMTGTTASAAPPVLSNLVVSPTVFDLDDALPIVTIAVDVRDPDGDLNPAKVKAIVKYTDGRKPKKIVLQDDGEGHFTGEVILDTSIAQDVLVKLKAKDFKGEKATSILQTVSIHDCGNALGNGNEIIDGPSGPDGPDHDSVFRSLTVHPLDSDIVLMGTERNGFVKSEDGGTSWRRLRTGLRHTFGSEEGYPEIWDIAFDPSDPSRIYAATLDSPGPVIGDLPSTHAGVYLSTDEGETWSRSNCGLSNSRITSVQVDSIDPNTVIIGVEAGAASFSALQGQNFDGGIYRSTDGGAHWSRSLLTHADDSRNGYWHIRSAGSIPSQFVTFGFWSFQNGDQDDSGNVGFLRSTDAGRSWEPFGDPVKNLTIANFDISADGGVVYANERDSFEIQRSTDNGVTWTTTFLNQANGPVAVSPADSDRVLYAGTSTLTLSTDGLESTQVVLEAAASINDVVFAPSDPSVVYVATAGYLIYKSTDEGQSFSFVEDIRNNVLNR